MFGWRLVLVVWAVVAVVAVGGFGQFVVADVVYMAIDSGGLIVSVQCSIRGYKPFVRAYCRRSVAPVAVVVAVL